MRRQALPALPFVVVAVAAALVASANAECDNAIPNGSWKDSCDLIGCSYDNACKVFSCSACTYMNEDFDEETKQSSVNMANCPSNTLSNDNGSLKCEGEERHDETSDSGPSSGSGGSSGGSGAGGSSSSAATCTRPGGSWVSSCDTVSCNFFNNGCTMTCTCYKWNADSEMNDSVESTVDFAGCPNRRVRNGGGRLECDNGQDDQETSDDDPSGGDGGDGTGSTGTSGSGSTTGMEGPPAVGSNGGGEGHEEGHTPKGGYGTYGTVAGYGYYMEVVEVVEVAGEARR